MDIDRVLNFSSNMGKIMLQNGGETYRVEETISKICQAFSVDDADVFSTPTAVIVSVNVEGKIYSIVKRVKTRGVDLNKVHKINALSRKIFLEKLSIEECEKELQNICEKEQYSNQSIILASGIAASSFTLLFGGQVSAIIASFTLGIIVKIISINLAKVSLNEFFINSICGAIIAIFSIILLDLGLIVGIDKLIAGSIMLLVPGLLLTNSIRDIIDGQLISGFTKISEAFLIGVSIAAGTGAIIHLHISMGGVL